MEKGRGNIFHLLAGAQTNLHNLTPLHLRKGLFCFGKSKTASKIENNDDNIDFDTNDNPTMTKMTKKTQLSIFTILFISFLLSVN